MFHVESLVIGAGAVGLAIARLLRPPLIIELNAKHGQSTSSRNSGVIHAGLYYRDDWLKTKLAIRGRSLLYDYCKLKSIPCSNCGKFIVASSSQNEHLNALHLKSSDLGIPTHFITIKEAMSKVPSLNPSLSILESTSSGIVDTSAYMDSLLSDCTQNGTDVLYNSRVTHVERSHSKWIVSGLSKTSQGEEPFNITADVLVNAAGLNAHIIHNMMYPDDQAQQVFSKGHYFKLRRKLECSKLVYPLPDKKLKSLGFHLTLELDGSVKFGPDVFNLASPSDYSFKAKASVATSAISQYLTGIDEKDLIEDYTGIRPKLSLEEARDFRITVQDAGASLVGIESPGLTSSMAIAELVKIRL